MAEDRLDAPDVWKCTGNHHQIREEGITGDQIRLEHVDDSIARF